MPSVLEQTPDANARVRRPQAVGGDMGTDDKYSKVMKEFQSGNLKSSAGNIVTNPKQAQAIAYSESKRTQGARERKLRES